MVAVVTEAKLRQLREGDQLKYYGVNWRVGDYSTYTDDKNYETEEWLIKSQTGKIYYLMRESDPQNPESRVHWYIAEELRNPAIYEPDSSTDLTAGLATEMCDQRSPYPALRLFHRNYQFESQTAGDYKTDGKTRRRITWDYWDETHLWNLALEAWGNGRLVVYSTREVQPADFSDIRPASLDADSPSFLAPAIAPRQSSTGRSLQIVFAWFITIVGFCLMISGL